jgi:hypothetical protein
MAIKDRDGNIMKIPGPNPIMKNQDFWDQDKITYINLEWKPIVVADNTKSVKTVIEKYHTIFQPEPKIEEEKSNIISMPIKPIQEKPIQPIQPIQEKTIQMTKRTEEIIDHRKIIFHCLPAITHKDELYGEERTTFGQKFTFEGVIADENDLMMTFWSKVKIESQSIVFPQSLGKRWWKVSQSKPDSGGFLSICIVTDINPDFSD